MINKNESIQIIKSDIVNSPTKNLEVIKATIKNGGGLLKILPDQTFKKIMLRRSRNYAKPGLVKDEELLEYAYMTWFTIDVDSFNNFDYIVFFTHDEETEEHYSLIFTSNNFKQLISTNVSTVQIYIQKIKSSGDWVITRLGNTRLTPPIDVSENLNNWKILTYSNN